MLSTRKRKDVQLAEVTVKVILFGFDLLYLDGEVPCSISFFLLIVVIVATFFPREAEIIT